MTEELITQIQNIKPITVRGKITKIVGLVAEGFCPKSSVGALCEITPLDGSEAIPAEIVGFRDSQALLMPLAELRGLGPGSLIKVMRPKSTAMVGEGLLGRVIDALGNPLDDLPAPPVQDEVPIYALPPSPMSREKISQPLDLGVKAINSMLTTGQGQRIAIMAGSGVGKSVLLGTFAQYAQSDVNVIAMIGERGREVREFIERDLGPEGLAKSVLVCATSDQSPLLRMRGAFVATAIAEYFCNQGKNVLLLMDSVSRFSMAMREVGLAIGEPPTTKGYTPSVFAALPKLLERAGNFKGKGSITGMYTVLAEGDDMNDPIPDTVRSIVDGHVVLSRHLAAKNHYPCIDILGSASRVMKDIVPTEQFKMAGKIKEWIATYAEAEDLININSYKRGNNPKVDLAIDKIDKINEFLQQDMGEWSTMQESTDIMRNIAGEHI